MPLINPQGLGGGGRQSFQTQELQLKGAGVGGEWVGCYFHRRGSSSGLAQHTASKCFTLILHM